MNLQSLLLLAHFALVAETLGGWHGGCRGAGEEARLCSGQVEGEVIFHIWARLGILLQRGNAALLATGRQGA